MDEFELNAIALQATAELDSLLSPGPGYQKKLRDAMEVTLEPEEDEDEDEYMLDFPALLEVMMEHNASDLHIKEGSPPMVRLNGELFGIGDHKLRPRECRELIFFACTKRQQDLLESGRTLDFAYTHGGIRFRINAYLQKSTFSASIRMLREKIPSFETLGLPDSIGEILDHRHGLVIVTGPAGAGKSTTLAAMIDYINSRKPLHIITIEDPIEYVHKDKKALVTQREIGSDTTSFSAALKFSLRQDPNVILIGEMRDPDTIMVAAQAAETGHLILSTLHTPNTIQAISRMLDVFSGDDRKQVRLLLANNLRGIVSQRLLPRSDEEGRVPAVEVMKVTGTISTLIMEDNLSTIYNYLRMGKTEGMQTMNQCLFGLYSQGIITGETALKASDYRTEMRMMLEGKTDKPQQMEEEDHGDTLMSWI